MTSHRESNPRPIVYKDELSLACFEGFFDTENKYGFATAQVLIKQLESKEETRVRFLVDLEALEMQKNAKDLESMFIMDGSINREGQY